MILAISLQLLVIIVQLNCLQIQRVSSFNIDYDNVTDQNYNSWNKVEYYDAYLTNGNGFGNDRSNQLGPRLVGTDSLPPKIGPSQEHDSNDNIFLMEVLDHGLQIVSAFGTGAYDGTRRRVVVYVLMLVLL